MTGRDSDDATGGASFTHVGIFIGTGSRVECYTYPAATPILAIRIGGATFDISARDKCADQSAVDFARALVRHAQVFAAEVERMHAAREATGTGVPEPGL